MKRIFTTLKEKWPEYFIEAFVIVGSILGAIALENWNEKTKIREDIKDTLVVLEQDLKEDLEILDRNLKKGGEFNEYFEKILSNEIDPSKDNWELVAKLGAPAIHVSKTGYLSALNAGLLASMNNEELKRSIILYYEINLDYINGASNEMNRQATLLQEVILTNSYEKPSFGHEISEADAFIALFKNYAYSSNKVLKDIKKRREIAEVILSDLKEELE